jgi:hypothetical protein
MSVDFADDEVCASVYMDLDSICDKYAKQIEVVEINENYVVCKFTDFLRHRKTALHKFIKDTVNYDYERFFINSLCKYENDITEDGGEGVYQFIEYYLEDFLTE